jgi:hypothetical protein
MQRPKTRTPTPLAGTIVDLAGAFAFNAALLTAAICAAGLKARAEAVDLYIHPATPGALNATRDALERFAGRLVPAEGSRTASWRAFVMREIAEGDAAAARGFALVSPRMLSARDATLLQSMLAPRADDAAVLSAAQRFLEPHEQSAFAPLAAGYAAHRPQTGQFRLGDLADLSSEAQRFASPGFDEEDFILAALGAADATDRRTAAGATILRTVLRIDALSPAFADEARAVAAGAYDAAALAAALRDLPSPDQSALSHALAGAARFQDNAAFDDLLAAIGDMADATSPGAAGALLTHAVLPDDLDRLVLIAKAGGERAYALAKRTGAEARLPDTAQGQLAPDRPAWLWGIGLLGAVLTLIAAPFFAVLAAKEETRRSKKRRKKPRKAPAAPATPTGPSASG